MKKTSLFLAVFAIAVASAGAESTIAHEGILYTPTEAGNGWRVAGWAEPPASAGPFLRIPATVEGLPVVAIAREAFQGETAVHTVSLPSTLRRIGAKAFELSTLRRIHIEESPEAEVPETLVIEEEAFARMYWLRSASFTEAGKLAFEGRQHFIFAGWWIGEVLPDHKITVNSLSAIPPGGFWGSRLPLVGPDDGPVVLITDEGQEAIIGSGGFDGAQMDSLHLQANGPLVVQSGSFRGAQIRRLVLESSEHVVLKPNNFWPQFHFPMISDPPLPTIVQEWIIDASWVEGDVDRLFLNRIGPDHYPGMTFGRLPELRRLVLPYVRGFNPLDLDTSTELEEVVFTGRPPEDWNDFDWISNAEEIPWLGQAILHRPQITFANGDSAEEVAAHRVEWGALAKVSGLRIEPAPSVFFEDLALGSGWYMGEFGFYHDDAAYPWVYHTEIGWIWVAGGSQENGFWFYISATDEWGFTGEGYLPWLFVHPRDTWFLRWEIEGAD